MNKDALSTLVSGAVNTILVGLAKVIDDRVTPAVEDGEELKVVLKRVITELQSEFKPVASSTRTSSTKTETKSAPKAKSTSKDVKKDENGDPIQCEGTKKSDNTRCTFSAKHDHEGKFYCGTHYKTAQGTKPNKDKKPSFEKKGAQSQSRLMDALGELDDDDNDIDI